MTSNNRSQTGSTRKIALVGFSGPGLATMEYCFSAEQDCELVAASTAQVIILNGDQGADDAQLRQDILDKYSAEYRVVISIRNLEWPDFSLLKKPHTSQDLLKVIRTFPLQLESEAEPKPLNKPVNPEDVDFYRGRDAMRKKQGEALKQKLIRGNLVVSAADRLVQQVQADIQAQEEKQKQEEELQAKREALLAKKKAQKILLLKQKKLVAEKKLREEKAKKLKEEKKKRAALKVKKLKLQLAKQHKEQEQLKAQQLQEEGFEPPVVQLTDEEILQCCGNAADVDLNRKEERRSIFFNPEGSLLIKMTEAVELAKKLEQPVEITGLPGQMFVFPAEGRFYLTFSDDFLNQLALTRFGYGELEIEPKGDFQLEDKSKHLAEAIEPLIWKVALWTSRGRLFYGMDPEKLVQLTTKPDFELYQRLPECHEISELWQGHQMSSLDVARIIDAPQRVVFSFMCGAYSLGWFQE